MRLQHDFINSMIVSNKKKRRSPFEERRFSVTKTIIASQIV